MQYSFSSEFLKIVPPATNFGEAWENLCLHLLLLDTSDKSLMRLGPPDRGIDIYSQAKRAAYQCKSSERGILGTIDAQDCTSSLARAIAAREHLAWDSYGIALNAPLSGVGLSKISDFAKSQGLPGDCVSVLPPEHWNALCGRYEKQIKHLFDYRIFVSEAQVVDALRKAQYYDDFVQQAVQQMQSAPLDVTVSNNRTPVELSLPFSGELTIEQLLDVVQSLLGISLDWANFPDLGTSCGPSLSITIDRASQPFKRKLSELTPEQHAKLQLWIKLVWRDKLRKDEDGDNYDGTKVYLRMMYKLGVPDSPKMERDRGRVTIDRMEAIIQTRIWQSISSDSTGVR